MTTHKVFRLSLLSALLLQLPLQLAQAEAFPTLKTVKPLHVTQAQVPAQAQSRHEDQSHGHSPIEQLQHQIEQLEHQLTHLQHQLKSVIAVAPYVSLETVNDHPTVRVSGANLQVVNGLGNTATANALGNLIIGYDEPDPSGRYHCTLGTNPADQTPVVDESTCAAAGGQWLTGFKTGSHYLVAGMGNNYSRWGALIVGYENTSNYDYATASGGFANAASGPLSVVSGGADNRAHGRYSTVSGGGSNWASGFASTVSGGGINTASGERSTVSGGVYNTASGLNSSVSNGVVNTASGFNSSVSGGDYNTASGDWSSVSGGYANTATGSDSSVSGGYANTASGSTSSVSGGWLNAASGQGSSVCGGLLNTASGAFSVACASTTLGVTAQSAAAPTQTMRAKPALPKLPQLPGQPPLPVQP